ncbi:adenine-specific methyltransferase EcoRI family protein [Microbacterium barkeri]|uniref:adenine-specific methyltransferase EcoRI family protein n=1 Tax=Microbacterium barkeri TaxID=33917 RepID=UPI0022F2922D|nr:adenine-specific methyltransferase EcoRI family protein [Microbacterium barkeri]MDI6944216.1 adenine-specific methyltransferase EcoRI family protein [Microbacterium barkeri]MDR6876788.1 hypothetical protein [Microbacterium barkeri]
MNANAPKGKNSSLAAAKKAKADEFYTQLSDIERELRHYKKHFKGKTVYLNCDDPRVSNFFHYFSYNFETLGLKKLIAACYKSQEVDLFSENADPQAIYLVYEGDKNGSGMPELDEIGVKQFKGDGDFRSEESIELLKEADIVVSNPPFSLFREYVAQLMEYDKKFVILGNQNTLTTKEIFELVRANKLWLGYNNGDMSFRVPAHYPPRETRFWIDENGQKWRSFGTMCWLTNLDIAKRHEDLLVWKSYDPELYPSYDNFDGIDVGKTADIPADYDGVMGVPVGFLTKHNPDQFEIVGITKSWAKLATKKYPTQIQVSATGKRSEVGKLNDGAVLQVDTPPARKTHYIVDGKTYIQTYPRILIRRRSNGVS